MGKINVLSFAVANLIAAGEVVDRPASVIKELMENAIDAGATAITVEIQNGGVTFMRVSDNGCGMTPEDLPVSIRRHATSKIRNEDDLSSIMTLGFRGEALAAIASVSDLRIISKTAGQEFGAVLEAHGGENITIREQGCSTGTTVIVEHLFANVPARRKFLKKDVTESMAASANVERVALSHPEIAFRYLTDGSVRLETAGDGDLLHTIHAVFGKDFAKRMLRVDSETEGVHVSGYISRSDNYKANRNYQNFFINGRFVKSKTALAALEQAYRSYMPPERFPCCVLYLTVDPAKVDVNVHPAKLEVKFSNEKPIFEAVYYAVRSVLESNVTRPDLNIASALRKNPFAFPGGKVSEATVPVENSRPESLRERQLSYDLKQQAQYQPRDRMTSAEFRNAAGASGAKKPSEPESAPQGRTEPLPEKPATPAGNTFPAEQPPVIRPEQPHPAEPKPEHPLPEKNATPAGNPLPAEQPPAIRPEQPHPAEPKPEQPIPKTPGLPVEPAIQENLPAPEPTDRPKAAPLPGSPAAEPTARPEYRILGVAFNCYILVEVGDKLLLIDQHAAHERILFERLKAGLGQAETASQMLMLPVEVMMTAAEVEALRQYDGELKKIGFSLRYARNTVAAEAIPEGVETGEVGAMLETMAGRLIDNTGSVRLTRDIIFEKALYQASCKAAIKGGREYAPGHIEWLVAKMMELPDITFCPHGRPVAMELPKRALDRQFDRTGF